MKQYYIKMDFNNWLGFKHDLIDGEEYPIYQDSNDYWCLDDEVCDPTKCANIEHWGDSCELNTSIAYTKDTPVATDKNLLIDAIKENLNKIIEANPASRARCDLIIEAVEELTK